MPYYVQSLTMFDMKVFCTASGSVWHGSSLYSVWQCLIRLFSVQCLTMFDTLILCTVSENVWFLISLYRVWHCLIRLVSVQSLTMVDTCVLCTVSDIVWSFFTVSDKNTTWTPCACSFYVFPFSTYKSIVKWYVIFYHCLAFFYLVVF